MAELLWPLIMSFLIVLLHSLGKKTNMPICHLKPRAMPSAGEVVFIRSFLCSINSYCDIKEQGEMPGFNSSILTNLDYALREAFDLSASKSSRKRDVKDDEFPLPNWVRDFLTIQSLIEGIKNPQNIHLAKYVHKGKYTCKSDNSIFDELRKSRASYSFDFERELDDIETLSRLKRKIFRSGVINSIYQVFAQETDKSEPFADSEELKGLDFMFCGPNVPDILEQITTMVNKRAIAFGALNTASNEHIQDKEVIANANDTDAFCDTLLKDLENKYPSRQLFRLFTPLIRGKIIYTPDAPVIKKMMTRINEALTSIIKMAALMQNAPQIPSDIDNLNLDDIVKKYATKTSVIRKVVNTKTGSEFLKHFAGETGEEGTEEDTERKAKKFQKILTETLKNWEKVDTQKTKVNTTSLSLIMKCIDPDRVIAVRNETDALRQAISYLNKERLWGLIIFQDVAADAEELPPALTYKIRTGTDRVRDTNQLRDRMYVPILKMDPITDLKEITGGFAYLQSMIEKELLREYTGQENIPGIYLKQMPFPCYVDDEFRRVLTRTFPMYMIISWIHSFCMVSKRIVLEKEILFRGTLRIFGISTPVYWLSWFIDALIPMIIVTIIISIMLVVGGLAPNSNVFVIWVFLATFAIPTITLAFLLSTFFSQSSFAMAVSGMLYFLLYLPYPAIQNHADDIDPYLKGFSCLISNVAFGLGCTWIANMEQMGSGAQMSHLNYTPVPGDPITMLFILEMFILDSILYLLLAIYLNNVLTESDAVKLPWYYCFLPSYWKKKKVKDPDPANPDPNNPNATKPDAANPTAANPTGNPTTGNPTTGNPSSTNPAAGNPSSTNPAAGNPSSTNPAAGNPSATNPAAANPSATNPGAPNPNPSTRNPQNPNPPNPNPSTPNAPKPNPPNPNPSTPNAPKPNPQNPNPPNPNPSTPNAPKPNPSTPNAASSEPFVPLKSAKDPKYFEAEPENLTVGIEVVNLTKEFGIGKKKKRAVNGLTINFYEDQITSFLGHNGAGKTTSISMMIGLLPITEGTVRIYGTDIRTNTREAVSNIGICRQENVLLDELTVEEHFKFFSRLKNRGRIEMDTDTKELIEDLQLGHRAKKPVKILSGGMKRKVCVAMAFIGGSRTVFLDEPTAGIDPYSRRAIWDLLVKYKKGRTIILTTHFMDEADLLGDRIAIISSGELQCCGSSMFLKSNLGRGYYLTIDSTIRSDKVGRSVRGSSIGPSASVGSSSQVEGLEAVIKKVVPNAEFLEEIGSEIIFILPPGTSAKDYNNLFKELDKNKKRLNFRSYGVTDTSLEEVFFKILVEEERKKKAQSITDTPAPSDPKDVQPVEQVADGEQPQEEPKPALNIYSKKLLVVHFYALIVKRYYHHRRNFKILLIEVILPILFLAIALAITQSLPSIKEMRPLEIDMSAYCPSSFFYSNDFPASAKLASYEESLLGPYGIGTRCVLCPDECSLKAIPKGSLVAKGKTEDSKPCTCDRGFFECDETETLEPPPNAEMSSGDCLYNLTGLNLSNWLTATEYSYSPHRLGGITFGHFTPLSGMTAQEFMGLFKLEKVYKLFKKVKSSSNVNVDPELFTTMVMASTCNKGFGDTLFPGRDLTHNVIIWYNNRAWIANLALMNGVTNIVLRASLPDGKDPSKYSIKLVSHPLPVTDRQIFEEMDLQTNIAILCALSIIWALSFIPAMYCVYLVEERVSGLKHLEIVSGVSQAIYWVANFFWDLISFTISIITIILLYLCFHMYAFVGSNAIGEFLVLLYTYGFVNISFVYFLSFFFAVSSSAFIFIACWNIFAGVATLLTTFTLTLISGQQNPYYLKSVFMIFPQFCFGESLVNMAIEDIKTQALKSSGVEVEKEYFDWDLLLKYIVAMLIIGSIFLILTFLIEYKIGQKFLEEKIKKKLFKQKALKREERKEDSDVAKERIRVESGKAEKAGDLLIMNKLTKYYSKKDIPAVDHLSVGIKRGECFGLLGLNGAGKTTVFKMLTGQINPTEGDTTIAGYSFKTNSKRVKSMVGYCPQINALDPFLTAKEHLNFFCRIRGFIGKLRKAEVAFYLKWLGLIGQENKIVKVLSGGNKRKVNTAISLICDPKLILLDEPTSGMDALSRRFIWNCLQTVVLNDRCVVLTSHSMEECQALCTQISIMVRGKFTCFGSSQHLKNKFDEGYSVTLRLPSPEKVQNLMSYISEKLPNSQLVDVHHLQVKYKLSPDISIGSVFTELSNAKGEGLIQDYSISQTTLESIFLRLAVNSEVPDSRGRSKSRGSSEPKRKSTHET